MQKIKVLVTGAAGFIGNHLVEYLKQKNYWVRGVDIIPFQYGKSKADEFMLLDLRMKENCLRATNEIVEVYALAADMGGMGYISNYHCKIIRNNSLINLNTLEASQQNGVKKYFFASSACVYPEHLQEKTDVVALKEAVAYPAQPQDAYGWEKLFTERLCQYYRTDYNLETRIARLHNIYGLIGGWDGGREKAPAAICRKVAIAKLKGNSEIEIWGDGRQTRSFCFIGDCITGIYQIMRSDYCEPLNLGSERLISINELVNIIADIAGIKISPKYISGPQGVRGRNSYNSLVRTILNWEPQILLEEGLAMTYSWIENQVINKMGNFEKFFIDK